MLTAISPIEAMNQKISFEAITIDYLKKNSWCDIVAKKAKCGIRYTQGKYSAGTESF